jgi:integrase/recombinase XerD
MNILVHQQVSVTHSPYRLLDEHGQEIQLANSFLDALHLRFYSPRTLRIYAYDLAHFTRWWLPKQMPLESLTASLLDDYVRQQLAQQPPPAPATINHRLTVVRSLYRFHTQRLSPDATGPIQRTGPTRSSLGYGVAGRRTSRLLRLRQPKRLILPLSVDEIARFWNSFHSFRDLALIALLLYNGLRSQEVLQLRLADLHLGEASLLVHGKGDKQRLLPLPPESIAVLDRYLTYERPRTSTASLFVVLKGPRRGQPLTLAGLRALFRYHRLTSRVAPAHPHRFRHTFGHDMVRAGLSLPALMQLMGHSQIRTTLLYVQLSSREVWEEFQRVVRLTPSDAAPRSGNKDKP